MVRPNMDELRYRQVIQRYASDSHDLADSFVIAGNAVRRRIPAANARDQAILEVVAGVAGPVLTAYTVWFLSEARRRGIRRLRFLSREGQVLFELGRRLSQTLGPDLDLEYVYGNRLTWNLAAADAGRLGEPSWLFNCFMEIDPTELRARLGLPVAEFELMWSSAGLPGPDVCLSREEQASALRRFLLLPPVIEAARAAIASARSLLAGYSAQHALLDSATGIVDTGWAGRQVKALIAVGAADEVQRPHVFFWGYQPPSPDPTESAETLITYMYNTATGHGTRLQDAPFMMEMLCMSDHGTVAGYTRGADGNVAPVLASARNLAAEEWGLRRYRDALYLFAETAAQSCTDWAQDLRSLTFTLLEMFWRCPTIDEATVWGSYPYDITPDGALIIPIARPIFDASERVRRDDPPWLEGSLVLGAVAGADGTFDSWSTQWEAFQPSARM